MLSATTNAIFTLQRPVKRGRQQRGRTVSPKCSPLIKMLALRNSADLSRSQRATLDAAIELFLQMKH